MPTWLKIVLAVIATGIVLLVAAGLLAARVIERGARAAEIARAEGEGHGMAGSLEGCVEEGVRRTGDCEASKVQCIFEIDAFFWGCLESAPYDAGFCAAVPAAGDDPATREWSSANCARYGMPSDELCTFNLSVVAAFCSSRE